MDRRKFITVLGLGAVASAGAYIAFPTFEETVRRILKSDLSKLIIEEGAIEKFISEIKEENPWRFSDDKKYLIMGHYYLGSDFLSLPYGAKNRQYRNYIVGTFLLSTDFFLNKMDSNKRIVYLGLYNPYKRPCGNPFSSMYYPS